MTFLDISIDDRDIKKLWTNLKASAKKRGIPFTITPNDLDDIGIPLTCPILGYELKFHRESVQDNSPSVDRIDSSKGYIKDNLVIISYRANKLKSDATLEEMERLVNFFKTIQE